jgi:DNA repair ATPase RecN
MQQFEIKHVNGIADLTITLDGPGVYVARGPNGAGKSSAIEALKAVTGDDRAKAEPSDGQAKGQVQASDGVLLAVGNRRRLNGYPSLRLVSSGAIGLLIDPGIKDSTLAARARLKALLQLMPLPADAAAKLELTANDEELQRWIAGDPSTDAMDLAEAVRKRANELANDLEKRCEGAKGEEASLMGLILELGQLDFEAGELVTAEAEASRLVREAEIKTHTARQRAELEKAQAEIRESLGVRPDVNGAQSAGVDLRDLVASLEAQLAAAKEKYHAARVNYSRLVEAAEQWDQRSHLLKRTPEGPTLQEAQEAVAIASAAQSRMARARRVDTAKGYQSKANEAKALATSCEDRAKLLRGIAQGTAGALGRLLERRGLPGLAIDCGRICVTGGHNDQVKDFETRLSFGEKVRAAIGIALAGIGQTGTDGKPVILPLEPTFWLALDSEHKGEVCKIAKERGVCLVTEEPDSGPLRMEAMP